MGIMVAFAAIVSSKVTDIYVPKFSTDVQRRVSSCLQRGRKAILLQGQVNCTRLKRGQKVAMSIENDHQRKESIKEKADMTKVVTIIVVTAAVLYYHNVGVILYSLGSVVNYVVGKVLKKIIKQPRPEGAAKSDHGMPSSHATSLSYLSVAAMFNVLLNNGLRLTPLFSAAVLGVFVTAMASRWRIAAGYHTMPQVVVGWIIGSIDALLWCFIVGPSVSLLLTKLL